MPTIGERIETDIIASMKARNEPKLTTLRMVKAALKSKEIDKRQPLSETEEQAILTTLIKQRRDSAEQFTKVITAAGLDVTSTTALPSGRTVIEARPS